MRALELPVLDAGRQSKRAGPSGGKRSPETIKKLKDDYDSIKKEFVHYTGVYRGNEPKAVRVVARHFNRTKKQINRIVGRSK